MSAPLRASVAELTGFRDPRADLAEVILAATAIEFGVTQAELRSPSTQKALVHARTIAQMLIRDATCWSLPDVARFFERANGSRLVGQLQAMRARAEVGRDLQRSIRRILQLVMEAA